MVSTAVLRFICCNNIVQNPTSHHVGNSFYKGLGKELLMAKTNIIFQISLHYEHYWKATGCYKTITKTQQKIM